MIYKLVLLFVFVLQSIASPFHLKTPSEDDFYTLPKGYKDAKPGDILKVRMAPNKLSSVFIPIDVKNVWQLVVRSEDSFGKATAFVTTIIEPYNADPSKVVSYQTFEDSSNINCSPSYGFQFGASISTVATQFDMSYMAIALKNGYFVNSPDYEGFNSAFTVGRRSGQSVLDSVRAVLKSGTITGIKKNAKVGLWGYSGGSLASGWAAALQPTYAPELKKNLIGASLGGFVTNITAVAESVDGSPVGGLTPLALVGLGNEYPAVKKIIDQNIAPKHKEKFSVAERECLVPALVNFLGTNTLTGADPMIPAGFSILKDPTMKKIIDANCIVNLNSSFVPQIPIFVYHGTLDKVVPIRDVKTTYKNWCKWGIKSFEFAESILSGHINEQIAGSPAGWTWLDRQFQGAKPVTGCSATLRLSNLFYPRISRATRQYFEGILDSVTGSKLGPEANSFKQINFLDLLIKY
ncbi:Lipase 1 [Spathaspora sp. JA1]|nr:Lipase 1 [Spathaspora sp. JA1]RLV91934.1 Lipase 1 [Spathaspora sp. JA1]